MASDLGMLAAIAVVAATASPLGGLVALLRAPTTLFMSIALGFASGVLLGTISFEMVPNALTRSSMPATVAAFSAGFLAIYAFDLFIHRGKLVGEKAAEREKVVRFHRRHRPRGSEVTVLAGGTSVEELIEGVSIGIGAAIEPQVGLVIALAIGIDNFSEGLSIGELILNEPDADRRHQKKRIFGWTGLIAAAVLVSTLIGWLLLRDLSQAVLGGLFGMGAGGIFYLTIAKLVPEAEERHYQQAAAIAAGVGFLVLLVLSAFL
ncbi:ZIP family metal transporter [Dongia deserti]|uniref:ZIP family metal transporter n=1 Tax=Dongia deserti TaxID=2268030 RepID=UPI000E6559A6|nr:ZIP family metal transporter [Dongia deserti]